MGSVGGASPHTVRNDAIFFCAERAPVHVLVAATAGDATMVAARDRNKGGGAGGGEPVRASAVMEGRGISGDGRCFNNLSGFLKPLTIKPTLFNVHTCGWVSPSVFPTLQISGTMRAPGQLIRSITPCRCGGKLGYQ